MDWHTNYPTVSENEVSLEDIVNNVLGEDIDYECISTQLVDCIIKLYPLWYCRKVRNEMNGIRKRYKGVSCKCENCEVPTEQIEMHHIISPFNLGGNDRKNIQFLCHDCHKAVNSKEGVKEHE